MMQNPMSVVRAGWMDGWMERGGGTEFTKVAETFPLLGTKPEP